MPSTHGQQVERRVRKMKNQKKFGITRSALTGRPEVVDGRNPVRGINNQLPTKKN